MSLTLLDWRRRVGDLYREIRGSADPRTAHQLWREARDRLFATHPDSPLPPEARSTFAGLDVAPYDPLLRYEAEIDRDVPPTDWHVPTEDDGVVPFRLVGRLHLAGLGDLDVWWLRTYGGGLFVPVKDGSAGRDTYGGGRYVLDTVKGADLGGDGETLVVDFNFAYNPSCAYDVVWSCPLAPPGNVLGPPVLAGELERRPHHKPPVV